MKKIAFVITSIIILSSVGITQVAAQDGKAAVGVVNPPSIIDRSPTAISNFVPTIISVAFYIGLVAAFVYMVYGGVRWITAGGDSKALAAARDTIVQAIIGLILLSTAFAVSRLFYGFFATTPPGALNPYDGVGSYCDGITYNCKQPTIQACVNNICECVDPLNCTRGPY
ncbi:MAG: pilin [bacterium]|nr:pilin [bacterium]